MSRARDIAALIGSNGQIDNAKITLDANEIPNLDTAKITTGTFADARISSSSVSQHAQSFDDNNIVNDISTLGLRQASDNNKVAYNTNSSFVDVFQDSTGVETFTNTERTSQEKIRNTVNVGSVQQTDFDPPIRKIQSNTSFSTGSWTGAKSNGMWVRTSGYGQAGIDYGFPTDSSWECRIYNVNTSTGAWTSASYPGLSTLITTNTDYQGSSPSGLWGTVQNQSLYGAMRASEWRSHINSTLASELGSVSDNFTQGTTTSTYNASGGNFHCAHYLNNNVNYNGMKITYDVNTNTLVAGFFNGTDGGTTSYGRMTVNNVPSNGTVFIAFGEANSYNGGWATNYSGSTNNSYSQQLTPSTLASATGQIVGDTITPLSSVSSMGAVITYENTEGTNTLNTDIVLELSADGGTNWTTATLTALPDFSTGIKMAKANDVSVTAGTSLKYRISTANQSYGTKQVEIVGVALQF